jgi:hypothetical protein
MGNISFARPTICGPGLALGMPTTRPDIIREAGLLPPRGSFHVRRPLHSENVGPHSL